MDRRPRCANWQHSSTLICGKMRSFANKYDTAFEDGQYEPAKLLPESKWKRIKVDTLFDLASNTKMYTTNYAIQKLVSEGKLNLDQTLSSFPGWENYKDSYTVYTGKWTLGGSGGLALTPRTGKETVTIRDILHHYGGLIPDPEYPNKTSAGALWYQKDDYTDRAGIIDIISKTPLKYTPRTTFAYSDVDFMILGLLVEQITGMSLDQYVEKNIYKPLGLKHTVYNPLTKGFSKSEIAATELNGNTRDGNVNFGVMDDNSPVNIRKYTLQGEVHDEKAWYSMGGVAGHAGLFSTVGDLGVLTQLMLNGGIYNGKQFFSKEVVDEFTAPYDPDPNRVDLSTIGLGWRVHSKSSSAYYYYNWGPSRSTYGHQGWTGTLTIIDPVYNMTITILTNLRHSPVVTPPNGFAGSNFPIGDLVPISALVYDSLIWDKTQYNSK
jgi:CubicO group peptidase (beta-lactamase class C family)